MDVICRKYYSMEASMDMALEDRPGANNQGGWVQPLLAPAEGCFFFCTMWVKAGCKMGRAYCEVEIPSGSRVPSRDRISHGSLHDFHGCHPTFMEANFLTWKLMKAFMEVPGRFHVMKLISTSVEVDVTSFIQSQLKVLCAFMKVEKSVHVRKMCLHGNFSRSVVKKITRAQPYTTRAVHVHS